LAIKGSLVEASLPEVIQLLAYSLKSGCLSVTDGKNFGNIFMKGGRIIYATVFNRKARLGDVMVEKAMLERHVLDEALRLQRAKKKRVGEILIELGAISRLDLEKQLREQIETTILTLLSWQSGFFNFEENLLPAAGEYTIDMSAQELLFAAARRVEDWQKIESKLPPFETVLVQSGTPYEVELTAGEQEVLSHVDGSNSIDDAIKESGLDFYEACKAIFVLLAAGIIEKPKKPAERKQEPGDMSEYKNIGFALYKTAKYDDAEREFKRVVDNEPDNAEALFYLGLIEIMRENHSEARRYLEESLGIEERISTLINIGYVCSRMNQHDDAIEYLERAKALKPANVKAIINYALTQYNRGQFEEAIRAFEQSTEIFQGAVTPYLYLALIRAKQGEVQKAAGWLQSAIDRFPRSIAIRNNLALLYECIGRNEEAERMFCQILATQPETRMVVINLANLYFRLGIYGAAQKYYEQIPEAERGFDELTNLGRIYLMNNEREIALRSWQRALVLKPADQVLNDDIEALRTLMAVDG
jgi:tetratricopeptide (TPR) repeat protein